MERRNVGIIGCFKEGMNRMSGQLFFNSRKVGRKRLATEKMGLTLGLDKEEVWD